MTEKNITRIGWFAALMAIVMYFSYVDQIRLNLSGNKGSIVLPIVTVINCTAWFFYAYLKPKKDWPIIICNLPGIVLGIITAITATV